MFIFSFLLLPDTDSYYIQFEDFTREEVFKNLSDHLDLSNFPPSHPVFNTFDYDKFAKQRKSQFGYLKVDSGASIIRAHIVQKKKTYSSYLEPYDETCATPNKPKCGNTKKGKRTRSAKELKRLQRNNKNKGIPASAAEKLTDSEILELPLKPGVLTARFRSLRSNKHLISMIQQDKNVSSSFDNSALYRSCNLCNVPFNCTLKNIGLCVSAECKRNRHLAKIWHRLVS